MPNGNLSGPVSARLGPSYLQFSSAFLSLFLSHSCLSLLSIQRKGRGMGIHDSSSLQWSSDEVQLAARHDWSLDFANSLYFFAPLLIGFCFTFSIISYFILFWNLKCISLKKGLLMRPPFYMRCINHDRTPRFISRFVKGLGRHSFESGLRN